MIRTVSMLPAATEIVGFLGLMDQLVAVSHECDFPEEANRLPRITHCEIHDRGLSSNEVDHWVTSRLREQGSLYTIDEALLRELSPDLILTQQLCNVCAPGYDSVQALALTVPSRPRVLKLEPKTLGDVVGCISRVADAMGHGDAKIEPLSGLQVRFSDVGERVRECPRPTVFMMDWVSPIYNSGHWVPEMIQAAGGIPVLSATGNPSARVPWHDLRAMDPEVIVIACCGQSVERTRRDLPALEALPGWEQLRAVRGHRTYVADGSAYFSRPGPRLMDSIEILGALLHPEVCGDYPDRGVLSVC